MKMPKEKAARTATPETAFKTNTTIVAPVEVSSNFQAKDYFTTKARFALKGHALQRIYRPADNCTLYTVGKWGHSRVFASWHDVLSFLTQVGGAA